jgi:hypothetical protein
MGRRPDWLLPTSTSHLQAFVLPASIVAVTDGQRGTR